MYLNIINLVLNEHFYLPFCPFGQYLINIFAFITPENYRPPYGIIVTDVLTPNRHQATRDSMRFTDHIAQRALRHSHYLVVVLYGAIELGQYWLR